jgi:hypothetical protein
MRSFCDVLQWVLPRLFGDSGFTRLGERVIGFPQGNSLATALTKGSLGASHLGFREAEMVIGSSSEHRCFDEHAWQIVE